jgi:hypothetical protein
LGVGHESNDFTSEKSSLTKPWRRSRPTQRRSTGTEEEEEDEKEEEAGDWRKVNS